MMAHYYDISIIYINFIFVVVVVAICDMNQMRKERVCCNILCIIFVWFIYVFVCMQCVIFALRDFCTSARARLIHLKQCMYICKTTVGG